MKAGRLATAENARRAAAMGVDLIVLTGNPGNGVRNDAIVQALREISAAVGDRVMLAAGKMHASGVAGEGGEKIMTPDDACAFMDAGADIILLPAPGTVPGITPEYAHRLIETVHARGKLALTAIGTSQEGADTATIRQIALLCKMAGADIHHIGDTGVRAWRCRRTFWRIPSPSAASATPTTAWRSPSTAETDTKLQQPRESAAAVQFYRAVPSERASSQAVDRSARRVKPRTPHKVSATPPAMSRRQTAEPSAALYSNSANMYWDPGNALINMWMSTPYRIEPVYQHRYPKITPANSVCRALKLLCPRANNKPESATVTCQGRISHSPVTIPPRKTSSSESGAKITMDRNCAQAAPGCTIPLISGSVQNATSIVTCETIVKPAAMANVQPSSGRRNRNKVRQAYGFGSRKIAAMTSVTSLIIISL